MLPPNPNTIDLYHDAVVGYRTSKVLFVAHELGVFEALEGQVRTAEAVAVELRCDARAMELLLRALGGVGVLEAHDGGFTNAAVASQHLVKGRELYLGHLYRFQNMLWECWSNLETVVRTGKSWKRLDELLEAQDGTFATEYSRGLRAFSAAPARAVAALLGTAPVGTMLDVGGGHAAYSLSLLEAHPELEATLLDLPSVIAVAAELTSDHPHRNRLVLRAGNYLTDDLGESCFDLILMSHITHDEPPEAVQALIKRAARALRPGGRLAIHDWVVDESGCLPLAAALFSVAMMVYTQGGQTYKKSEYLGFFQAAGLSLVEEQRVLENEVRTPTHLLVGRRS